MTHMPGVPIPFDPPSEWSQTLLVRCRSDECRRKHGPDGGDVWWREHESSDGAFEDTEFECRACGTRWWVDGIDL